MTDISNSMERRSARWWIPALLLLAFAAQCFWFARTQAITFDEPTQIQAGMYSLQAGAFLYYNDAPLARHWFALPLAQRGNFVRTLRMPYCPLVIASNPTLQTMTDRARPMVMLLGLALGAALWFATRRLFSEGAANVAPIYFAGFQSVDPKLYGVRAKELGEQERVEGLVVLSPVMLSGLVLKDPGAYRWVMQYPRVAVLDHVLQVYDTRRSK